MNFRNWGGVIAKKKLLVLSLEHFPGEFLGPPPYLGGGGGSWGSVRVVRVLWNVCVGVCVGVCMYVCDILAARGVGGPLEGGGNMTDPFLE